MSRARLVHHVPGRLRLCVDAAKRDSARLSAIQEGLRVLPGVRRVSFNPTLGTLVIAYDPALSTSFAQSLAGHASKRTQHRPSLAFILVSAGRPRASDAEHFGIQSLRL